MTILLISMALPARSQERCDLLVLPIFGVAPPEMKLPTPDQLSELFRSRLPKDLTVAAEEPAGRLVPEDVEGLARERARVLRAGVVIWGELKPPANCRAPRALRLYILDLKPNVLLQQDLCPKNYLRRRVARAVFKLIGSDLVPSLRLADSRAGRKKPLPMSSGPPGPGRACPEPRPCPAPDCPPPVGASSSRRARGLMAAGMLVTSHPGWESAGLGVAIEFSYSPLAWLEAGLGVQASWSRQIDQERLQAVYSSWPVALWGRAKFGRSALEGLLDLGLQATFTRLEEAVSGRTRQRVKPAVIVRLGIRWLGQHGPGVQVAVGSTAYLAGQTYGDYSMPWYSLELMASLVAPIW